MHEAFTRVLAAAAGGALCLAGALVVPSTAGASDPSFCHAALVVTSVPMPMLPSSDSLDAISAALARLPGDVTALKRDHANLVEAAASAPTAALAAVYRVAAAADASEDADLVRVENESATVLLDPDASAAVTALANDVVAAARDAATVDAYLSVERSQVVAACG